MGRMKVVDDMRNLAWADMKDTVFNALLVTVNVIAFACRSENRLF
jgi:hypothetical protein